MARPREISDERILEVARDSFLSQGASFTTAKIAARLNISQSLLYQRFGNKEKLLLAALAPNHSPKCLDLVSSGPDEGPIPAQLLEIATELTHYYRRVWPTLTVLRQAGVEPKLVFGHGDSTPPQQLFRELTRWFERAQSRGRVRGIDPAVMALAFQGALPIQPYLAHIGKDLDDAWPRESYLPSVVQIFWGGIAPGHDRDNGGVR